MKDKKTAIFDSTLKLIAKQGFHGASMFSIASKARVAAGTIYHYFKSKEQLINELYLFVLDQLDQVLLEGFEFERPIEENLKTLWINWFNFYLSHPKEFLFLEQYGSSPFVTKFYLSRKDSRILPAVDFLGQAKEKGFFKDLPTDILVGIFYGPIVAIVKTCIEGKVELTRAQIEAAFEACLTAVRK